MRVTRDEIVAAADWFADAPRPWGLCEAFWRGVSWEFDTESFTSFITSLGGRRQYQAMFFWPLEELGREQRLVFLAFMLAWHDDITGTP